MSTGRKSFERVSRQRRGELRRSTTAYLAEHMVAIVDIDGGLYSDVKDDHEERFVISVVHKVAAAVRRRIGPAPSRRIRKRSK